MSRYEIRKLAGLCTRGSCTHPALADGQLCAVHAAQEAKRVAQAMRALRAKRAATGLCVCCGRRRSDRYRCAACQVAYEQRQSTAPRTSVTAGVTTPEPERSWRDADNRLRYHGQLRRGAPSTATIEAQQVQNLEWAIDELRRCIADLAVVDRPEFVTALRAERKAAQRAALSRGAFAIRLVEEVLEHFGYSVTATEMVPG